MTVVDGTGLTTLRSQPVLAPRKYYLSVAPRETVLSGQVNGSPLTDDKTFGIYGFAYDNETGTPSDAKSGMSVDLGTSAGARDLGTVRLRLDAAGDDLLYIAETPFGEVAIENDVYFTVKREFRPWLVMPRGEGTAVGTSYTNTITLYMDYDIAYSSQNEDIPPKANISRDAALIFAPHPAGFVDAGQVYRTVTLSSANSYAMAVGASIASRLWDVGDGTITVGTATSTSITVRFPVGFRYISLVVTDSNGTTSIMYYPIWVHDDDNLPISNFTISRDSTTDWREVELDFFQQDTDETIIPRGTTLCFWEVSQFSSGTAPKEYRGSMLGWAWEDSTDFTRYKSGNRLLIKGLAGWLASFRGFSQRISDTGASATSWFEMEDLTMGKIVHYVLGNFTNAHMIGGLQLATATEGLKALDITLGNVWQQVQYILSGNYTKAACDSLNVIWVRKIFSYASDSYRGLLGNVIALTPADWADDKAPEITRRNFNSTGFVHGTGAWYDEATGENTLLASRAPGRTPAHGEAAAEAPFQNLPGLTASAAQDELNVLTGFHWAYLNNPRASVTLELLYNMDVIEPAWQEPISLTAGSDYSNSGLLLAGDRFLVKEVNITYDDPFDGRVGKRVTLTLEGETSGVAGEYEEVPEDSVDPDDRESPVDIPDVPSFPISRVPEYDGDLVPFEMIVFDSGNPGCHTCEWADAATGAPVWIDRSSGLTGYTIWATANPYNYGEYWALQSTGLYKNPGPFTGGTWSLVSSNATLFGDSARLGGDILMSINRKGWIAVTCGHNICISFNFGTSWGQYAVRTDVPVGSGWVTDLNADYLKIAVSPYNDPATSGQGWMYAGAREGGGYSFHFSDDWGATWVTQSAPDTVNGSPHPHIPYIRTDGSTPNENDASQEVFAQGWDGSNNGRIWLITGQGTVPASYYFESAANLSAPASALAGRPMSTFTWDGRRYATAYSHTGAGGGTGLIHFDNAASKVIDFSINGLGTNWNNTGWTNRSSTHSLAILYGSRLHTDVIATLDEGANLITIPLPVTYTGCAYGEWSLRTVIPPS